MARDDDLGLTLGRPPAMGPVDMDRALLQRVRCIARAHGPGTPLRDPTLEVGRLVAQGTMGTLPAGQADLLREAATRLSDAQWQPRETPVPAAAVLAEAVMRDSAFAVVPASPGARRLARLLWHDAGASTPGPVTPGQALAAMPAQAIARRLSSEVIGQDEAARALALLLWHHARGQARSLVIAGPSGSGKTALARAMEGLWPDTVWVDGASLTKDGWSGSNKLSNMFRGLTRQAAERAVVVIDEADKTFEPKHTSSGEDASLATQAELLKYMDGGTVQATLDREPEPVSCERVSFVLLGSFEWLLQNRERAARAEGGLGFGATLEDQPTTSRRITKDDLVRYGSVRREVAGRVMAVAMVRPLAVADYLAMLRDHAHGPVARLEAEYGMGVELTDGEAEAIAERAASSGLGVRSLLSQLESRLDERVWDDPDGIVPADVDPVFDER